MVKSPSQTQLIHTSLRSSLQKACWLLEFNIFKVFFSHSQALGILTCICYKTKQKIKNPTAKLPTSLCYRHLGRLTGGHGPDLMCSQFIDHYP